MKSTNPVPTRFARTLCLLALLPLAPAYALSTDKDQPIHVEANSVEIDDRKGISIYQGDVDVKQGSIHMTADKVTVYQTDRRTDLIKAVGRPVRFQQRTDKDQTVKGRAREVEYRVGGEELVLTGDARLSQGEDNFSSDRIIYDRKNARVKAGASAKGSERVRITITPGKK